MQPTSFDLTLEQQFEIRRIEQQSQDMSREQAIDLLLQVSQLLMVRDNLIKDLMKQTIL